MLAWPLLGFLAWRDGGIDFGSPIFTLATLFITVSGPVQTLAAWRLATPELRQHPRWFVFAAFAEPVLLHRVQEPDRPRRAPQAAARRAPVGGHAAHRRSASATDADRDDSDPGGGRMTHDRTRPHCRPDPTTRRRPARIYPLTWLRGLAALAVVTFHAYQHNRTGADSAWPWSGGAAPGDARHRAVRGDVLRALRASCSGCRSRAPPSTDGWADPGWVLLFRRMARLLPLYYAVVLVVWAMTNPSLPGHWQDLLLHLTFTHVYSDQYIFWTDGPAWSLAVEFHFYVLMALWVPLVHAAVRRTPAGGPGSAIVSALPGLLVAAGLAYLAWRPCGRRPSLDNWSVLFSPLSRAADFGIGTGLAVVAAAGVRLGRRARAAARGHRAGGPGRPGGDPARSCWSGSGGTRRTRWRSPSP